MTPNLKQKPPTDVARPRLTDLQAEEIARDLALLDELKTFVQSLPRHPATNISPQKIREMAYEEREASLL